MYTDLNSPLLAASSLWSDMFVPALPVAEKMLRPVIVYAFLVVGLRVFGKRELAQVNPFDIVVLLSLANTVQNAIIGNDNSVTGGLIGAATLLTVNYLVVRFFFGHRRLDQMFQGTPTLLIDKGETLPREMAKELVTESELLTVLHRQGFSSVKDVTRCELEPGGTFSVEPKRPRETDLRHDELLARIDALSRQVASLQEAIAKG